MKLAPALRWTVIAATLALVFAAYQHPSMLKYMVDAVWSCF